MGGNELENGKSWSGEFSLLVSVSCAQDSVHTTLSPPAKHAYKTVLVSSYRKMKISHSNSKPKSSDFPGNLRIAACLQKFCIEGGRFSQVGSIAHRQGVLFWRLAHDKSSTQYVLLQTCIMQDS